jgi:hypothetical protein
MADPTAAVHLQGNIDMPENQGFVDLGCADSEASVRRRAAMGRPLFKLLISEELSMAVCVLLGKPMPIACLPSPF